MGGGYVRTQLGRVFVVRWLSRDLGDLKRVWAELEAARKRSEEPLLYVGIMTEATAPATPEFRAHLGGFATARTALCETVYLVFEGTTADAAVERANVGTILRASHLKPVIARSVPELLRLAGRHVKDELKLAIEAVGVPTSG
jgi:hypothetical protein